MYYEWVVIPSEYSALKVLLTTPVSGSCSTLVWLIQTLRAINMIMGCIKSNVFILMYIHENQKKALFAMI